MALRKAKIQPTTDEKRYITLNFLESAYVSGTRVVITPVKKYSLSKLSGESFEYGTPVETFILYDERPKVSLLKRFGWYREDQEELPQIAHIPTHLLYRKYGWNIGENVPTQIPEVQPTDGDKWADVDNETLYIYEIDEWVPYSMPTAYYAPTSAGQYLFNPKTAILHMSIFAWDSGTILPTSQPTTPEDGDRWFDKVNDMLYTYDGDTTSWDAGVAVPTELYDPMSENLYYFDEGDNKLFRSTYGERVANEVLLDGNDMQNLTRTGEADAYIMKPLEVKRGTLIDVFYDFAPDSREGDTLYDGGEFKDDSTYLLDGGTFGDRFILEADMGTFSDQDDPYDFPIDNSIVVNRFYVTAPKIDTVSITYVCKLMAYKFDADKEAEEDQNKSNGEFMDFNSGEFGV